MATLKEIYEDINGEVTSDLLLGATSPSKVSEFRLIEYVVSSFSEALNRVWEIFKVELIETAEAIPTCNADWWDREIRRFQFGYTLAIDNITKKYYYNVQDAEAQIVTSVAVVDQSGKGIIKVAKEGNVALTASEKSALSSYIKKVQPLGSNILLISQDADLIRLSLSVYYDPIIPKSTVQANVEQAINRYLSSLDFQTGKTGTFYATYLIDAIQGVDGVVDVASRAIQAGQSGGDLLEVSRKYVPVAGHLAVDPGYALADTITYIAEV